MDNPVGLNGMEFVEFADKSPERLTKVFENFGFTKVANHKSKNIELWRQGDINFLLNCDPHTFAGEFTEKHGPCVSSMGFRVKDRKQAFATTCMNGASQYGEDSKKSFNTSHPTIYGIGDSLIYFIDVYGDKNIYDSEYDFITEDKEPKGKGFVRVDHLTNNVPAGDMQKWCDWYQSVFNFRETRFFDIKGLKTGLESKVMMSPCKKIIIPVNEPTDDKSQIQEYINEYNGSGVQHLALLTNDIISSMTEVKKTDSAFLEVPSTYYEAIPDRVPNVTESMEVLEKLGLLVDGDDDGYLLQIFSQNLCGPIFFEVIQRKEHDGFGEGNFQALFEAIERDQEKRGVL